MCIKVIASQRWDVFLRRTVQRGSGKFLEIGHIAASKTLENSFSPIELSPNDIGCWYCDCKGVAGETQVEPAEEVDGKDAPGKVKIGKGKRMDKMEKTDVIIRTLPEKKEREESMQDNAYRCVIKQSFINR